MAATQSDSAELLQKASGLMAEGQMEAAEKVLESALKQTPDSPRALALLGVAQYQGRRYRSAEESLQRAVELGHRDLRTDYYLASTLWENGKLAESEAQCREALTRHPDAVPLVHILGRLYRWQGRYEEAADWIGKGTDQSPGSVDLWLDLAGSLEGAGHLERALEAYRRAAEIAPEHYQVRYGLARVLSQLGEAQAAESELARYRQLLSADQRDTRERGWLHSQIEYGRELARRGEAGKAVEHLSGLPKSGDVWLAMADAYLAAGDPDGSLLALEMGVAQEPGRQDLRARLAAVRIMKSSETP